MTCRAAYAPRAAHAIVRSTPKVREGRHTILDNVLTPRGDGKFPNDHEQENCAFPLARE